MRIFLLICCCANQPLFTFVLTFSFIFTFILELLFEFFFEFLFEFIFAFIFVFKFVRRKKHFCILVDTDSAQSSIDLLLHLSTSVAAAHHVLARCIVHYFYWFLHKSIKMYCASFYWFLHKIPPRICQMYLCIIDFYWFLHKSPPHIASCIYALLISINFFIKCHDLIKILIPPFGDFLCIDFSSPQYCIDF